MKEINVFNDLAKTFNLPQTEGTKATLIFYQNIINDNINEKDKKITELEEKLKKAENTLKELRNNNA